MKMLKITDTAKEKIQEILNSNPGKLLRVEMQGYGWGGPTLGLALDEPTANEAATPINGINVLISEELKKFVDEGTIDYKTEPWREGFTIKTGGQSCC